MFSNFPNNSHTAWFDPQTKKLKSHCISQNNEHHMKVLFSGFPKNHLVTLHGLFQRHKSLNHTVSQNKQHDMKVFLSKVVR